jgi:MYXO-CTERM domain-containing protein
MFLSRKTNAGLMVWASLVAVGLLATAPAQGVLITEHFDYGTSSISAIGGSSLNGGTGWGGPWVQTRTRVNYVAGSNVTVSTPGYVNATSQGFARADGGGSDRMTRAFGTSFGPGSTVWGSYLIQVPSNAGGASSFDRMRLEINGDDSDEIGWGGSNNAPGSLLVRVNGSTTQVESTPLGSSNLLIFKMETDYSGVNDRLTLWTNPADASSLGTGSVFDGADIWGSSFSSIAMDMRWANGRPAFDSLRFSGVDLEEVLTGEPLPAVPEPAALGAIGLGALALIRRR